MDSTAFFILNLIVNSLLTFFTAVLLIEAIIFCFRVKQGRLAAYMRMVPIAKLVLDPFLYDFSRWSYLQEVNPLLCEEGTRMISAFVGLLYHINEWISLPLHSGIQMTIPGDFTFTVADLIGNLLTTQMLYGIVLLFSFATALIVIGRSVATWRSVQHFRGLLASNSSYLECSEYQFKKEVINIRVLQGQSGSPFVTGAISPTIFLPEKILEKLSREEYEAVIAHEVEHIRYKDNLVRMVVNSVCIIFWWVPTAWLKKRVDEGLEVGCDGACRKYELNPIDLASALCKSVSQMISSDASRFAYHLTSGDTLRKRIDLLLSTTQVKYKKTRIILSATALGVAFLGVLFGRYWIF